MNLDCRDVPHPFRDGGRPPFPDGESAAARTAEGFDEVGDGAGKVRDGDGSRLADAELPIWLMVPTPSCVGGSLPSHQ